MEMSGITKRSWVVLERVNVKFCAEIEALFVERDRYRDALSNLANAAAIYKGRLECASNVIERGTAKGILEMKLENAKKVLGATGPRDEEADNTRGVERVKHYWQFVDEELAKQGKVRVGATGSPQPSPEDPLPVEARGGEAAGIAWCDAQVAQMWAPKRPVWSVNESAIQYTARMSAYVNWLEKQLSPSPNQQFHPGQAT